jgi:hypothetical protein
MQRWKHTFQGTPPLKEVKNRNDIPDSFIVQSIYKLSSETKEEVHVVAGDEKVRNAFSNMDSIFTYESLSEFIESDHIQRGLKDLDLIENKGSIAKAIKQFENDNADIMTFISNHLNFRHPALILASPEQ